MPALLLGPQLRFAGETDATIWVETDGPCTVTVLEHDTPTFQVAGHHYAIVRLAGLTPGEHVPYAVHLDGERVWPLADSPFGPSLIRTRPREEDRLQLAFGSCRVSVPHEPPYALPKDDDARGREVDALVALAERMAGDAPEAWPDVLLLVGDQVYADEVSPAVRDRIAARRSLHHGPAGQVADFEEYTWLYQEAWSDPHIRWLLSTVPSVMIFDDHDVHDDWNTSASWVADMRGTPWWRERILGAYASYWLYQHLGNLSPADLDAEPLLARVQAQEGDAAGLLRDFAAVAEAEVAGARWSFRRDFGRTRLLVLDSRAGRVLEPSNRAMLSEPEWDWIRAQVTGDVDHLLLATSLPVLLAKGLHHLETWNEAACDGAWGDWFVPHAEKIRQGLDLEHWSAFGACFEEMATLLRDVGTGAYGPAPASVVLLSGDVHHAYLAEAGFPKGSRVRSAVVQAVCSPIRNPLNRRERTMLKAAQTRVVGLLARALAKTAGVPAPPIDWRLPEPPTFDNQIATLRLDGRAARLRIEKTRAEDWEAPRLHTTLDRILTPGD